MPFIPWRNFGICKYWMVTPDSCRLQDNCKYLHARPEERQVWWDYALSMQRSGAREMVEELPAAMLRPLPFKPAEAMARENEAPYGSRSSHGDRESTYGSHDHYYERSPYRHHDSWYNDRPAHRGPYEVEPQHSFRMNHGNRREQEHRSRYESETYRESKTPFYGHTSDRSPPRKSDVLENPITVSGKTNSPPSGSLRHRPGIDGDEGHLDKPISSEREEGEILDTKIQQITTKNIEGRVEAEVKSKTSRAAIESRLPFADARSAAASATAPNADRLSMPPPSSLPRPRQPTLRGFSRAKSPIAPNPKMAAIKGDVGSDAKPIGPHPSTIRVSKPYTSQATISKRLHLQNGDVQEKSIAEAREDNFRLQGVNWLDNTRRALGLPIRTFTTACVYYHKFRLAHPGVEYSWADASAASLLTACKAEDTLKKSKDILAAAYNLKSNIPEKLGSDDPIFEGPSRQVIGLERLVLEASGFDFRSRYPHRALVKIARTLPGSDDEKRKIGDLAWTILTDLHRTFAPLKQTSSTLALASLEVAFQLTSSTAGGEKSEMHTYLEQSGSTWSTTRGEIMETLMDALDLYTHHTTSTILGSKYTLDEFLRIRLALNKECTESNVPRFTAPPGNSGRRPGANGSTLRVSNGHPTPVSPPQAGPQPNQQSAWQAAPREGETLRFMLDHQLAADERAMVETYYVDEWEEYEEEVEVPIPQSGSRRDEFDRADGDDRRPLTHKEERDRERERLRETERELERERNRLRASQRGRDRRYDDRGGFDDRDRRYDDRRGPPQRRYDDRGRYDDERRGPPRREHRR